MEGLWLRRPGHGVILHRGNVGRHPNGREDLPAGRDAHPELRGARPNHWESHPDLREARPEHWEAHPELREARPEHWETPPNRWDARLNVRDALPNERETPPNVREARPNVREAPSEGREALPSVREAPPNVREAPSARWEALPDVRDDLPRGREALPKDASTEPGKGPQRAGKACRDPGDGPGRPARVTSGRRIRPHGRIARVSRCVRCNTSARRCRRRPNRRRGGARWASRTAYASSTLSFLPTAAAARSRVASVTEGLEGSSNRSTAGRLVFMRLAISDLVTLQRFISWAI